MSAISRASFRRPIVFTIIPLVLLTASSSAVADPPVITLNNLYVSSMSYSTTFSQSFYQVSNTGDIIVSAPMEPNQLDAGDWISPKSGMSNYQVRKTAGDCQGPPVNQWIPLNYSPSWVAVAGGYPHAYTFCWMTIEISAIAAPSTILGSASIGMDSSH